MKSLRRSVESRSAATPNAGGLEAYVRTAIIEGRDLEYLDIGAGQPILLVHGTGGSWRLWRRNVVELAQGFRIIVPSLPGFGDSDRLSTAPNDLKPYADCLAGLLDELGIDTAVAVGHSLGGLVCIRFASVHQPRLQGLVLVDTSAAELGRIHLAIVARGLRIARVVSRHPRVLRQLVERKRLRRRFLGYLVHDPDSVEPETLAEELSGFVSVGLVDAVRAGAREQATRRNIIIAVPTSIIWGRYDRILPLRLAHSLAKEIPHSQLVVIEDVGHAPMFEDPTAFNVALVSCVRGAAGI